MDNNDLYGRALTAACGWVGQQPKLTQMLDTRDPVGSAMLSVFMRVPAVRAYLYTKRITRHREAAQELLEKAHAWIYDGGQTSAIVALYRDYRVSGRLVGLSPVQSAVLRAVFGLAIVNGPMVLASLRYLAVVVENESGIRVTPDPMRRHLNRLDSSGLIEFLPGRRGHAQHPSTWSSRCNLSNLISQAPEIPDMDTLLDLELKPSTLLALFDYRNSRPNKSCIRSSQVARSSSWSRGSETGRPNEAQLNGDPDGTDSCGSQEEMARSAADIKGMGLESAITEVISVSNTCGACRLPPAIKHEITIQRRQLVPLRDIERHLRQLGHPLGKDAIARHFDRHVAPLGDLDMPDTSDRSGDGLLVARAVADQLRGWTTLTRAVHARLIIDGATEAAEIIAQSLPAPMRPGAPTNKPVKNVRVRVMVGDFTFTPPEAGPWPLPITSTSTDKEKIQ